MYYRIAPMYCYHYREIFAVTQLKLAGDVGLKYSLAIKVKHDCA